MLTQRQGRVDPLKTLARGAAQGLVWGIVARAWMRLIAEDPEFTWGGTGYILGAATIFGLATGLAAVARRNGWRPRWRRVASAIGGGSVILIGMGAGSATLPTIILGGVVLGRREINLISRIGCGLLVGLTAVVAGTTGDPILVVITAALALMVLVGYRTRVVLAVLAVTPAVFIMGSVLFDDGLPMWQRVAGAILYLPMVAPLTMWFGRTVAEVTAPAGSAAPGVIARSDERLPVAAID